MKYVLMFLLLVTTVAMGQDIQHAPTIEQCRADLAVWSNQTKQIEDKLPVRELAERESEMLDCAYVLESAYPSESKLADQQGMVYGLIIGTRASHFLKRHNIWTQFNNEDAKGAR